MALLAADVNQSSFFVRSGDWIGSEWTFAFEELKAKNNFKTKHGFCENRRETTEKSRGTESVD